jgi:hypothetical protein
MFIPSEPEDWCFADSSSQVPGEDADYFKKCNVCAKGCFIRARPASTARFGELFAH